MSEQPSQHRSQISSGAGNISYDSEGNSIMPYGLTQAQKHIKAKPRFAEFSCTTVEVCRLSSQHVLRYSITSPRFIVMWLW
jgi:hypothetical protein